MKLCENFRCDDWIFIKNKRSDGKVIYVCIRYQWLELVFGQGVSKHEPTGLLIHRTEIMVHTIVQYQGDIVQRNIIVQIIKKCVWSMAAGHMSEGTDWVGIHEEGLWSQLGIAQVILCFDWQALRWHSLPYTTCAPL